MRLRRATPDDLGPAGAVTVAAYAAFVTGEDDPYLDRLRDAARRDREAELWVAVDDGNVLGTVTICPPGSSWREISRAGEGEFRMLAVHPAARGRGVGAALVDLVLDRFRYDGATAVVMSSLREMADAHRLYARAGFTRLPERDFSPAPDVQLIAFGRDL
ncbi:GNAT family N-acetyltransferase [Nocardioides sp. zg-579]|uniref:GNAT family N-acetyltransferase n=1 Tax=Nocardioides marmotae TaxID=2663857 RepID=A0A6I3JAY4_9ACTN|nr:GNAT family N-acetyltransferase [Nocardioides marmotae]MCR6031627.1 GNAT family N-acetyltransferase [Gordonia jinghuaiqii]MTB95266.1 GNAT family N-acetyltransferase [Nocardioides marmotae]QKE02264.1 GNAT family N-acetyltransferase [Nocardioides marmotae]